MSNKFYNKNYFSSTIFDFDYGSIADAIIEQYHPQSVIEFGCGNGDLSRALSQRGVVVEAMDGYAQPDFSDTTNIRFTKVDFNNSIEVEKYLSALNKKFDVALSLEVGEHLEPAVSASLVKWMTSMADVVVFSSAVTGQGGDGHINCRPRGFWHDLFLNNGFMIGDNIRSKIRGKEKVARWYKHNVVDYYKVKEEIRESDYKALVKRLVDSDSAASSDYYKTFIRMESRDQVLNMQPIRFAFRLRNAFKLLMGKTAVKVD